MCAIWGFGAEVGGCRETGIAHFGFPSSVTYCTGPRATGRATGRTLSLLLALGLLLAFGLLAFGLLALGLLLAFGLLAFGLLARTLADF